MLHGHVVHKDVTCLKNVIHKACALRTCRSHECDVHKDVTCLMNDMFIRQNICDVPDEGHIDIRDMHYE